MIRKKYAVLVVLEVASVLPSYRPCLSQPIESNALIKTTDHDVEERLRNDLMPLNGMWYIVPKIQTVLNDMSPSPDYLGRLDCLELSLTDMPFYWIRPELQKVEKPLKRLADDRGHSIVATGMFEIISDRPPKRGYLMITHKDGERFLCVLDIEKATFTPWRIHFVPGKDLERDLLILEIEESGNRQIAAFQRFIPGVSKKLPLER